LDEPAPPLDQVWGIARDADLIHVAQSNTIQSRNCAEFVTNLAEAVLDQPPQVLPPPVIRGLHSKSTGAHGYTGGAILRQQLDARTATREAHWPWHGSWVGEDSYRGCGWFDDWQLLTEFPSNH
jgi:hypothetical protein